MANWWLMTLMFRGFSMGASRTGFAEQITFGICGRHYQLKYQALTLQWSRESMASWINQHTELDDFRPIEIYSANAVRRSLRPHNDSINLPWWPFVIVCYWDTPGISFDSDVVLMSRVILVLMMMRISMKRSTKFTSFLPRLYALR